MKNKRGLTVPDEKRCRCPKPCRYHGSYRHDKHEKASAPDPWSCPVCQVVWAEPTPESVIFESLTEIFKAVTDYVDGGCYKEDIKEIVKAYQEATAQTIVQKFYGELVEERSLEVFGPRSS